MFTRIASAARVYWREPTFALTAAITLALGVGTTATVFSVVDAELWRPLPYSEPDRLVQVYSRNVGGSVDTVSGADLLDWGTAMPALTALAGEGRFARRTLQVETAEPVSVREVTANYFDVLDRRVVAGRTFTPDDARGSGTAVLTDRAWRRLLGEDRAIVGRTVTLDDRPVRIVGIVPADDTTGPDADVFVPADERAPAFLDRENGMFFGAIGRLGPDAGVGLAQSQLDAILSRTNAAQTDPRSRRTGHVEGLREFHEIQNWRPLYFVLGASLVVLLLAVVNVSALLLGRALRRTREFAVRRALGAGKAALVRQLLAEGAVLAGPAGALGVLIAMWAVAVFASQLPADALMRGREIPVDYRVWIFAFGITALTTLLFALTPLLASRRIDLTSAIGAGGRTGRSVAEGRARLVLLAAQLALTMVLIAGAGMFLKSFVALTQIPLGFEPEGTFAIRASLTGPRYETGAQVERYADELLVAARALPGVRDAAVGSSSPLGSGPLVNFTVADEPAPAIGDEPRAIIRAVGPGFFRTLGIELRGREFDESDTATAPRVAIVNEHLAREQLGGEPLGRVIELVRPRAPWTRRPGELRIVGVAANIKEIFLNEIGMADIYVPFAQMPAPAFELLVRAGNPPAGFAEELRRRAALVDPQVPVSRVSTFEQRISTVLERDRFNLLLLSGFAAMAVLLAVVGVYGAIAYAVQVRTQELGVRLALGARPSRLVGITLRQAGWLGLAGGAAGVGLVILLARLIGDALYLVPGSHNGLLYGVSTTDPVLLASAFAGIVVVALLAALVPARRVARLDPVAALKGE